MQRFKNKFAFITGGTNGMGLATAQRFIDEGGQVIITGRRKESVYKATQQLGDRATGLVSNAGSMEDILQLPATDYLLPDHSKHLHQILLPHPVQYLFHECHFHLVYSICLRLILQQNHRIRQ